MTPIGTGTLTPLAHGDAGVAPSAAQLNGPSSLCFDSGSEHAYIADTVRSRYEESMLVIAQLVCATK